MNPDRDRVRALIGGNTPAKRHLDNTTVLPASITSTGLPVTLGDIKSRLSNLEANLEEEGAYTRSNTVWLALEAIKLLQGLR